MTPEDIQRLGEELIEQVRKDEEKRAQEEEYDRAIKALAGIGKENVYDWMNENMDIRQILSENAIRDFIAQEDEYFLRAVNACV